MKFGTPCGTGVTVVLANEAAGCAARACSTGVIVMVAGFGGVGCFLAVGLGAGLFAIGLAGMALAALIAVAKRLKTSMNEDTSSGTSAASYSASRRYSFRNVFMLLGSVKRASVCMNAEVASSSRTFWRMVGSRWAVI